MNPMKNVTRTPAAACLNCGHRLNALGNLDDAQKPEPGCIIICIACGGVMKLSTEMTPEGFTDQEMDEIMADRELMKDLADKIYTAQMAMMKAKMELQLLKRTVN